MIPRQEAQAKFNEYHEAQGETTCHQLSKRLPDNSTILAAKATAISLALNYYQQMGPVHNDVVVYSDSVSCLQAIEGEVTENHIICHKVSLLWLLVTRAHVFLYAGYRATVALREEKEWTN